jgi:hypothetical protein
VLLRTEQWYRLHLLARLGDRLADLGNRVAELNTDGRCTLVCWTVDVVSGVGDKTLASFSCGSASPVTVHTRQDVLARKNIDRCHLVAALALACSLSYNNPCTGSHSNGTQNWRVV